MSNFKELYLQQQAVATQIDEENRRHQHQQATLQQQYDHLQRQITALSTSPETTIEILQIFDKVAVRGDFFSVFSGEEYYSFDLVEYLTRLQSHIANGNYRRSNLEVQDNAYGGNCKKYLSTVQKGFATSYHPCLFTLSIQELSEEEESILLRWLSQVVIEGVRVKGGEVSNDVFATFLHYKQIVAK